MTSVIRYIQLLLFAGILIVACEDDSISPDTNTDGNDITKVDSSKIDSCLTDSCITSDSIKAAIGAEPFEIYLELLAMYRNSCVSCLEQFLGNWAKKFPRRMDVHDSVKAVYEIFYEFYTPGDLNRIGDSEWGPDIYKDLSYYVIQNEITYSYSFQSTETGGSARYVIEDFRPAISNNNVTPIYLTEELEAGVAAFLV